MRYKRSCCSLSRPFGELIHVHALSIPDRRPGPYGRYADADRGSLPPRPLRGDGLSPGWKRNWKRFIVIGIVNSGLPFLLFSFAALYVPASVESVLNALSPLFGAIFSALWLAEALTARKVIGLVIGASGVAAITSFGALPASPMLAPAIIACVLATACYGLGGVYIKKRAADLAPKAMAAGSQFAAGILILPLAAAFPPKAVPVPAYSRPSSSSPCSAAPSPT